MKKYFSILLVLIVALTGCGQKTPYEKLSSEVSSIKSAEYAMFDFGVTVDGVEVNYQFEVDPQTPLVHMTVMGQEIYVNTDTLYAQVLGTWYSAKLTDEQISAIEDQFNFDVFELTLPDGDVANELETGIKSIDTVISGKKLNELVIETETGYTIQGLEDSLNITTVDGKLNFEYENQETGDKGSVTFGKTEKFELPAEALDGKELPTGYLDELL